ncbi:MAG: nucleotide sugar dehydrogenase [Candidatus Altiarchaeota archaeon]|nr:nucleotide sugar dehydrogenase [Candidatus Altiarchaeota archaeon]
MVVRKICVVGLGYVGLPTALAFAEAGFKVIGADIKEGAIKKLQSGKSTIPEIIPDARIQKLLSEKSISFTTDAPAAVRESDAILITVPTPVDDEKNPDLAPVRSAAESIAKGLGKGKLVVLESTVYPGVTEEIVQPILEKATGLKAGKDFGLAFCPERYNPGDSEHTIENMKRVVGAINEEWLAIAADMYSKITKKGVHKVSNIRTAEAAKVIENIQRDLNIGLMNELALIFDKIGVDTREVIQAASTKWNFQVYWPGPGVGGHCLPVDPYYLVYKARQLGYSPKIITAGREVNDYMAYHVAVLAKRALAKRDRNLRGSKITILGASYKGNVADARETPARRIVKELLGEGAQVCIYDPLVPADELKSWGIKALGFNEAVKASDCVIIHSDHDEFKELDLELLKRSMRTRIIVDTRAFVDRKTAQKLGFLVERI